MMLIHLLIGVILGKVFGSYFFFILGSLFPDIDHVYIAIKNKLWKSKRFWDSIIYEKKYHIRYKTPLFHSLLGLAVFTSIMFIFSMRGALFFSVAYFLHLLMDWADIDIKYYLYPSKIKFKGFLPIWSNFEKISTIIIAIIMILLLSFY